MPVRCASRESRTGPDAVQPGEDAQRRFRQGHAGAFGAEPHGFAAGCDPRDAGERSFDALQIVESGHERDRTSAPRVVAQGGAYVRVCANEARLPARGVVGRGAAPPARTRPARRGARLRLGVVERGLRRRRVEPARLSRRRHRPDQAGHRCGAGVGTHAGRHRHGVRHDRSARGAADASSSASACPGRRSSRAGTASRGRSRSRARATPSRSCARSSSGRARSSTGVRQSPSPTTVPAPSAPASRSSRSCTRTRTCRSTSPPGARPTSRSPPRWPTAGSPWASRRRTRPATGPRSSAAPRDRGARSTRSRCRAG